MQHTKMIYLKSEPQGKTVNRKVCEFYILKREGTLTYIHNLKEIKDSLKFQAGKK